MPIYYVDPDVGVDTNDGLDVGAGHAWETLSKAMDTVAAGDTVYCHGTFNVQDGATGANAEISTPGTVAAPITIEGYSSTPGDGGEAIIDATSSWNYAFLNAATVNLYYVFRNLRTRNTLSDSFRLPSCSYLLFEGCDVGNSGGRGVAAAGGVHVVDCAVHDIVGRGIEMTSNITLYNSDFYNCGGHAINISSGVVQYCRAWGPTANLPLINLYSLALGTVMHCTLDGGDAAGTPVASHGIYEQYNNGRVFAANNIIMNCGVGIGVITGANGINAGGRNVLYGCTTKRANFPILPGDLDDVDPQFIDRSIRDYRLKYLSPAKGSGWFAGATPPALVTSRRVFL